MRPLKKKKMNKKDRVEMMKKMLIHAVVAGKPSDGKKKYIFQLENKLKDEGRFGRDEK